MTDLRAAAQQALEALTEYSPMPVDGPWHKRHHKAIHALRAALEQPEQEPVAKSTWQKLYEAAIDQRNEAVAEVKRLLEQPEQEPVACIRTWHKGSDQHAELLDWTDALEALPDGEHHLYTHPPRREWRGLTDDERAAVQYESCKRGLSPLEFMELHEAKLKEKNYE